MLQPRTTEDAHQSTADKLYLGDARLQRGEKLRLRPMAGAGWVISPAGPIASIVQKMHHRGYQAQRQPRSAVGSNAKG